MTIIPQKTCTRCKQSKPLDQFKKRKSVPSGYKSICKLCANAAERERRAILRKTDPVFLEKERAHSRANAQRYYADPERYAKAVAYRKDRYYNHPGYRKGVLKRALASCHTRRARTLSNGGSFTPQEWDKLCAECNHRCLCCGELKPLTRDHIVPISKGGSNDISNIQPLCETCNKSKHDKSIDYRTSHNT